MGERDARLHVALQTLLRAGDIPMPDKAAGVATAMKRASQAYNVPISYLLAMVDLESKFDLAARSNMGAVGLAQVMPATARTMDQAGWAPASPAALLEPEASVLFGAAYLAYLRRNYGNWGAVFTVYNMGPGNYQLHQAETLDGIVVNDYALAVQHAQIRWDRYLSGQGPAPFRTE